ncbi:MAG: hypothetical protein FJ303_16515 [Planctomycetes bacterium]|nr:hypothetical protein [Planctomycetota bacterium]
MKRILEILVLLGSAATLVGGANASSIVNDKKADANEKVKKANGGVDWPKMLAALRDAFAKSGNATLEQTRIDRAYFELNEDDPDQPPYLIFKGVCLRTALDDEKAMQETLRRELGKFVVPNVKYVLRIDSIEFHLSPIYALQDAAVAAFKVDATFNNFFERATYGPDGSLRFHVLCLRYDQSTDGKLAKLLADGPVPVDLRRLPDGMPKAPTLVRRDWNWLDNRLALQREFTGDPDPLIQRTRFDDGVLRYSTDRKSIHFQVSGACIHPPALVNDIERAKRWTSRVAGIIPRVSYHPVVSDVITLPNPSLAWQNRAADDEANDGVFFHLASFDYDGKIQATVQVPSADRRDAVLKLVQVKPAAGKLLPIIDKNVRTIEWKWSDVKPRSQGRLAEGDFVAHRTRLDRMFLKYADLERGIPALYLDGVALHPVEAMPAEQQRKTIEAALGHALPIAFDHQWNSDRVRFVTSPIYAMQTAANARNLDGMLFSDARYDHAGKLHLVIALANDEQRAVAKKIVDATQMPDGVQSKADAKTAPPIEFLTLAWDNAFKQMQSWLARDSDSLLRKTRVDRGFFSYPASKVGPDLNLAAVGIYPKKPAYQTRLTRRFDVFARLYFTDHLKAGTVATVPNVRYVDNPSPTLQSKVADTPTIDGARIDDASFDASGKLVLHGVWTGKDQQTPLERLVRALLTDDHPALQRGFHWGSMQDFDSPGLLLAMRTWVAAQEDINEVRIERLFFDGMGKVRVAAFATAAPDKDKTARKLPDFLPKLESKKLPSLDPDAEDETPPKLPEKKLDKGQAPVIFLQDAKDAGPIRIDLLDKSVRQYLRESITKEFRFDGLRIDRCYYDVKGVLHIDGLADRSQQVGDLKSTIDSEAAPFDRKRQLPSGWAEGRQVVIPIDPMKVALKENLPSLSEFDGVTLHRAFHNVKNELEVTASVIGEADKKDLEPILKRLLETHPRWRHRTSAGVAIDISDRKKADRALAKKQVFDALRLLQVNIGEASAAEFPKTEGWWSHDWPFDPKKKRVLPTDADYKKCLEHLDAAILHDPLNMTAWYLRGYCLQTQGRSDLTLRDFRRMAAVEIDDTEARHARIVMLELVQGSLRQSAFRIEQQAIVEVTGGWTLRELRARN